MGEHFILTKTREPVLTAFTWAIYPNPFRDEADFVIKGIDFQPVELQMFDLTGRLVHHQMVSGGFGKINKGRLSPGLYIYEINLNGKRIGQGKLVIE